MRVVSLVAFCIVAAACIAIVLFVEGWTMLKMLRDWIDRWINRPSGMSWDELQW